MKIALVSDLSKAQVVSAAGMHAQTMRIRVISENVAHADSMSPSPGEDPYRRKTISFSDHFDKELGVNIVAVNKVGTDSSNFNRLHRPNDPAADKDGFVYKTNVNSLIEMIDLREATQTHAAGLQVYQAATTMLNQTIDALKA